MLTVVESPLFQKLWPRYWDEDERAEFASFIALNPDAGTVIRGSGGVRKVRWAREAPQTWEERKQSRVERSRPFGNTTIFRAAA